MVELGFVAVASLVQTWDGAEPDEDDGKALANWKTGCATVANTFSELLQLAWLMPAEEVDQTKATPPSCLSDASVLLAATLRYMPDSTAAITMKEEPLLEVWANLVADWNAWEDEEGEAVLIRRGSFCFAGKMSHVPLYKVWDTTSTSTSGCPTVQPECLVIFLTTAIELAAQQPAGMHAAALMPSCMCLNSHLKEKGP